MTMKKPTTALECRDTLRRLDHSDSVETIEKEIDIAVDFLQELNPCNELLVRAITHEIEGAEKLLQDKRRLEKSERSA